MCQNGGLEWAGGACDGRRRSSTAGPTPATGATPFVADPAAVATSSPRSTSTSVDATVVSKVLRANGIVDTESYRKLGRNQLRIALFPAIEPDDVEQLTRCIDHILAQLGTVRDWPVIAWISPRKGVRSRREGLDRR